MKQTCFQRLHSWYNGILPPSVRTRGQKIYDQHKQQSHSDIQITAHSGSEICARIQGSDPEPVKELLSEIIPTGHKALIFSQFTSFLSLTKSMLDHEGYTYAYLDSKSKDRAAQIRTFQESEDCNLFLISLKAGGVGLNLTSADYVFLLDPWWNPAIEAQTIEPRRSRSTEAVRPGRECREFRKTLFAPSPSGTFRFRTPD